MSDRYSERIPVVPPEDHPYMHDLYGRARLEVTAEQTAVMGAARHLWSKAETASERAEVGELLLGRRIDEGEINSLPFSFTAHVFEGGEFDGMVAAASHVVEAEQ